MENNFSIENLKFLKKKTNLTNEQFASLIQISLDNLKAIFYGNGALSLENQEHICGIFNITINDLRNKKLEECNIKLNLPNLFTLNLANLENYKNYSNILGKFFYFFDIKGITDYKYLANLNKVKEIIELKYSTENLNLTEILDSFLACYKTTKNEKVCINLLNAILLFWLVVSRPINDITKSYGENLSHNEFYKETVKEREREYIEHYYNLSIELLSELKKTNKHLDFIEFYLALKMTLNFFDKKLCNALNQEAESLGIAALIELSQLGNTYAIKVTNQGDFL